MSEKAFHINKFLRSNQAAAGLLEGVERDGRLVKAVQRALPAELRPHCLYATLDGRRLSLLTDGPVWASRLRFAVLDVLARLCAQGVIATEARVRVTPAKGSGAPVDGARTAPSLSQATVRHLKMAAATIDDADLAAALLRLAGEGAVSGQETAKGRGP
jgi:hypothetical protein